MKSSIATGVCILGAIRGYFFGSDVFKLSVIVSDNENRCSLADIEKSLAVLCLDAPVGLWEQPDKNARQNLAAGQTIHGGGSGSNGGNRWYDKTVQVRRYRLK